MFGCAANHVNSKARTCFLSLCSKKSAGSCFYRFMLCLLVRELHISGWILGSDRPVIESINICRYNTLKQEKGAVALNDSPFYHALFSFSSSNFLISLSISSCDNIVELLLLLTSAILIPLFSNMNKKTNRYIYIIRFIIKKSI